MDAVLREAPPLQNRPAEVSAECAGVRKTMCDWRVHGDSHCSYGLGCGPTGHALAW